MLDEYRKAFREEAFELLGNLEDSLMALEESPKEPEVIGKVFRIMHTIKGSSAMFGFDEVCAFTHEFEAVYELLRKGQVTVSHELIEVSLAARDLIRDMIESAFGEAETVDEIRKADIVAEISKIISSGSATSILVPQVEQPVEKIESPPFPTVSLPLSEPTIVETKELSIPTDKIAAEGEKISVRIIFKPFKEIFSRGINPIFLIRELSELGECISLANSEEIPPLEEIDPELSYLRWDIVLHTKKTVNLVRDVFIFVESDSELKISRIDDDIPLDGTSGYKKLGEILVERGDLKKEELFKVLNEKKKIGEALIEAGATDPGKVEAALLEQKHLEDLKKKKAAAEAQQSIRVASERLDNLVNLIGELVTVQARLSQTAANRDDADLLSISEIVERLTGDLRESALNIRMLPIGTTFSKFKRLVRDLMNELGKDVELLTEGAETELDKTVIEKLGDPLIHLIRNAVDHGIENPEERQKAGKPKHGRVVLSAMHSGAHVIIEIRDDGKGLDPLQIKNAAIERGLIPTNAELTDREAFAFLFLPGFTTAKEISKISGRGVGLDVVKRSVDELRGNVVMESQQGHGTNIKITLPLTLAIIDGLLVKIEDRFFVIPLSTVHECIELTREGVTRGNGKDVIVVRGEMIPYIILRKKFAIEGKRPDIEQVVVTESEGHRVGLVVDHVIGEHQTVIKSLGKFYRDVADLSGATILGDGSVALIVDVQKIRRSAEKEINLQMS
ncbi:MAG: chemotaxis protein CheA [Candidatus Riflebacteria bacterium]|nr:chemotaxis protein CheA [Candidatus Riflebacteria bacterium]